MGWLDLRFPPLVVALAIAGLMRMLATAVPVGRYSVPLGPTAALAVVALAAVVGCLAVATVWRAGSTIDPHRPHMSKFLVTGGIYRVTRNPMYLSLVLLLAAWAMAQPSWSALVGPPLLALYLGKFQIAPEERALTDRFGEEYWDYCSRVRRWL